MKLSKYYKNAIGLPALIILGAYILFALFCELMGEKYVGKKLVDVELIVFGIYFIGWNAINMFIFSLTIFLNKYESIKLHTLQSAIAWFLCPLLGIFFILYKANFPTLDFIESLFVIFNIFPYLIGLTVTFFKFRREIKN